ncbi:MAG: hypothetical protein JWP81_1953 [Ferruginibacter sp.]|nr:hypothetical protein [Ferruginibacter sp.]
MAYSTDRITTSADCDLLLALASKTKADLSYKQLSEERQRTTYDQTSVEIDADLLAVIAEITASQTVIDTLADGPSKQDSIKKKTKLEYQKFLLNGRKENYGSVALLQKEMDVAMLGVEVAEIDVFIAALTARKASI